MAEVATSVLHNVGNVLNSVNVSGAVILDKVRKSRVSNFCKAADLLEAHKDDLIGFVSSDPKGKRLPGYLASLAPLLAGEQEEILQELTLLLSNIEHIKEIVSMQQNYSRVSGATESLNVIDLVEDAVRMNSVALQRHEVTLIRDFQDQPVVVVDKHKVLQILVNLIRNAKYALDDGQPTEKRMTLRVAANGNGRAKIVVIDNGVGIPEENLTRIFAHGFTTRKEGHGFGLHSGALAAKELGGSLTAHSDGPGKGATFTLEFPSQPEKEI
jgi:signal transduction histidine kinase